MKINTHKFDERGMNKSRKKHKTNRETDNKNKEKINLDIREMNVRCPSL